MARRRRNDVRDHCARLEEDDGLDPRLDDLRDRAEKRREERHRPNHRDAQLAKVAWRVIERELCSMGPAIASGLSIIHVEVIGAGSHLRVRVAPSTTQHDPGPLARWLNSVTPIVRASLAHALSRKRVPTLTLQLTDMPTDVGPNDGDPI